MTIKEIANLTGKTKRTIELWCKSCENNSHVCEKITQAKSIKKPADFTLEETIAIIRAGGKETLADLLAENAKNNSNTNYVTKNDLKEFGETIVKEIFKQLTPFITNIQNPQIEYQNYYSILGYANKKSITLSFSDKCDLGKLCTKLSKENGIEYKKIYDERYGQVGSYHINILEEAFSIYKKIKEEEKKKYLQALLNIGDQTCQN